jgi:4'-phosphopantetheinyl transferase
MKSHPSSSFLELRIFQEPLSFQNDSARAEGSLKPEFRSCTCSVRPELKTNEIHVWQGRLDFQDAPISELFESLSGEERQRASGFHFSTDRFRFMRSRGLLRMLLGRYLETDPARVKLTYGSNGKPELAADSSPSDLTFNLSHSEVVVLYAIARGRRIGVDIERIRPGLSRERIPEHFFSPTEVRALRALPAMLQPSAFLACWTRKEAYLKARGDGLTVPLNEFEVSVEPNEPPRLLKIRNDPEEAARWTLWHIEPARGYVASVAAESGT